MGAWKGDDTTYLELRAAKRRSARQPHLVIDMENMLAALSPGSGKTRDIPILSTRNLIRRNPREGRAHLQTPRHVRHDQRCQWTYGTLTTVTSTTAQFTGLFLLRTFPGTTGVTEYLSGLPSDEPAVYIKIKDGMYLFSRQNAES